MLTQEQKSRVFRFIRSLKTKAFTFRDVVRFLELDSNQRRSLQHFLDELDAQRIIHRIKRGRYRLPDRENLVEGILHCHRDGYGFLVPDDRTTHSEDIFIPARGTEGALHKDRVLVKLARKTIPARRAGRGRRIRTQDKKERLEGYVVRVLERRNPSIVGKYYEHPRHSYVVPLDARINHDIRIPYQASKGACDGQLVVARITIPPDRNQISQGEIEQILGNPGDPEIEYKIVVHKFGLAVAFRPETLREADELPDHVSMGDHPDREDLRNSPVFTIDGETARDFDDAVSLRILPSGSFLLGVHIADVSHYVREGSALDLEAYERGTSVYFPDHVIPMLPPKISSGICSLKPDADRLVLSVLMELDRKGNIAAWRLKEGVLRSCRRLTYDSVSRVLVQKDPEERAIHAELVPILESMAELCVLLSKKRYRRGAVDFDLPETEIRLDEHGTVTSVLPAERNIAHRIIEEFMLQANECVAKTLSDSDGPALYRVHEEPDPLKVEEFAAFAHDLGFRLQKHNDSYRPKDFQSFVRQLEGKAEQRFLSYLMLRSFMQARYSEKNLGHFGLATRQYTHFTSPIRRYPDLFVHRLIKHTLKTESSSAWKEGTNERLPEIALHASKQERIADEAEREIEKIKKSQFMADKIGRKFDAVILSTSKQGFFVEVLQPFVDGFVPIQTLVDDFYRYDEKTRSLVGERRRRRYRPGTRLQVRLDRADLESAQLTFSVASSQ